MNIKYSNFIQEYNLNNTIIPFCCHFLFLKFIDVQNQLPSRFVAALKHKKVRDFPNPQTNV